MCFVQVRASSSAPCAAPRPLRMACNPPPPSLVWTDQFSLESAVRGNLCVIGECLHVNGTRGTAISECRCGVMKRQWSLSLPIVV